ncbi:unnamed protein product [Paramecium pentaurelia]|uniref:Uncharacterized protein n=1 Tax=Paramecium pentaurelia TaxID=43138 RepID=A0A8S1YHA3_9CILI|nr:unnamed protein product [Paramecium pentaurelia]
MSLTLNQKNNSYDQDNQSPLGIKQEEIIPINFKKNRKAQYYQMKHLLIKRLFMDQVQFQFISNNSFKQKLNVNIAKQKKLLNQKGDEFLIKLKLLEQKQEDIEDQISTFEICL